jgi:predicted nicotinamide N-methyase
MREPPSERREAGIPPSSERGPSGPPRAEDTVDPAHFFDAFPRFLETSETGPWLHRLNARYLALIDANRNLIRGASVLDLASHDGRFSFAALHNGATRVIGIEHDAALVQTSHENMSSYGVEPARYEFVQGDIFDAIERVERCDIVFCFGILYHINDHMLLLTKIAEHEPRFLVVDTKISQLEGAVIEVRSPLRGSPPPKGSQLEGYPSRGALDAMFSSLGWEAEYFDWAGSGLTDGEHMGDYRAGHRVSALVTCNEVLHPPEVQEQAVRMVLDQTPERRWQWLTITDVASKLGLNPQALRVWVRRAERAPGRAGAAGEPPPPP